MKWLRLILFFTATANRLCANGEKSQDRIVGGHFVSIADVPYQAQIISEDDSICGATIISEYWLISAAHCFVGSDTDTLSITTGSSQSFLGEMHEIENFIVHPNYTWYNHHDNDISLIKLKAPMKFKVNQRPIEIANRDPTIGECMKISGYGWDSLRRKRSTIHRHLKAATIKIVDQTLCAERYEELFTFITSNMFCAGVEFIDGSCIADSGGPGVIDGKLAGVVSGGFECNAAYYPGIYTRVNIYRDWIAEQTGLSV